ncbi:MAG TPA: enoyl-CoA hydratase/isomerase family protein [Stellaceae bacterium]
MTSSNEILLDRRGGVAVVTLNRPKALNTLSLDMYRTLAPDLFAWADDPAVRCVVIRGEGGKAFCAGGDVRAIYDAGAGAPQPGDLGADFFREEYILIQRVHRFPRPYVALIDGITMGGGVGMSVNGSHRIATENTMLAMPETAIGLFPDVGATHFLSRCPGQLGMYLALTGARMRAADLLYCGLATHFVPRERLPALIDALTGLRWIDGREHAQVNELLASDFAGEPESTPPLAAHRGEIDRCFAAGSVEGILDALERERTEWAAATRDGLLRMSPSSLKVTFRQIRTGAATLEEALALEYRLTQHFMQRPDFFEGVRALLVDKDQSPKWRPATVAEVSDADVAWYFQPLGPRELTFD